VDISKYSIRANAQELGRWAGWFEIPDVIYLQDIVTYNEALSDDVRNRLRSGQVDGLSFFPYPKGNGDYRDLALLTPPDLVATRSVGDLIAPHTDGHLPPAVVSNRLARTSPAWRLRHPGKAHAELRRRAKQHLLRYGGVMAKLDVKTYYPTIDLAALELQLRAMGCGAQPVTALIGMLRAWAEATPFGGILIGPEVFGLLGNAYILPMDLRFIAMGLIHLRWVDDVWLFGQTLTDLDAGVAVSDEEFAILGVERLAEKTKYFESVEDALAAIEDTMLASMFEGMSRESWGWSRDLTRRRFEQYILEANPVLLRHFRAIVKTMVNRRDSYALHYLAVDPSLLNIDPYVSGEYVRRVGLDQQMEMALFVDLLDRSSPSRRNELDARDLHLLRACSSRSWGRAEGEVFWRIAVDQTRRGPVRAWALKAAARSPAFCRDDVVELMFEDSDPYFSRACVVTLKRSSDDSRVKKAFQAIPSVTPHLFTAKLWVLES
jgi:hypothetical protein